MTEDEVFVRAYCAALQGLVSRYPHPIRNPFEDELRYDSLGDSVHESIQAEATECASRAVEALRKRAANPAQKDKTWGELAYLANVDEASRDLKNYVDTMVKIERWIPLESTVEFADQQVVICLCNPRSGVRFSRLVKRKNLDPVHGKKLPYWWG